MSGTCYQHTGYDLSLADVDAVPSQVFHHEGFSIELMDILGVPDWWNPAIMKDRREFPRSNGRGHVAVVPIVQGYQPSPQELDEHFLAHSAVGELADISLNGMAFLIPHRLPDGAKFAARLTSKLTNSSITLFANVVRGIEVDANLWKVVGKFTSPLTFDGLFEFFNDDSRPAE